MMMPDRERSGMALSQLMDKSLAGETGPLDDA
jgi:hypothetical protein